MQLPSDQYNVVISQDGSPTVVSELFKASYHSMFGALKESEHVFIKEGLGYFRDNLEDKSHRVRIFEMGLGTGSNALLSLHFANENDLKIQYTALEAYPLPSQIIEKLDFSKVDKKLLKSELDLIHLSPWGVEVAITPRFHLKKLKDRLEAGIEGRFDIIYFDAFASSSQPELWTPGIFLNMFRVLENEGILVTYAATGKLKRILKAVGFEVHSIPGPPGKREMVRALKH